MPRFLHPQLVEFGAEILAKAGVPAEEARVVARLLAKADLCGYAGHGIFRVPAYVEGIRIGQIRIDRKPAVMREGKTTALIDARFYLGQIAALQGMKLAIRKAEQFGVGVVCIARAAHSGRLADYVELAAEHGMIGMGAVSVGSRNIAPYGGMQPFTGTNPMAFGIPGKNGEPILLDFATSASSMAELRKKAARGEPIDEGVMLDSRGMPTRDFQTFLGPPRGVLLPFGGYKGAGLNLMTEVLGGLVPGNDFGPEGADKIGAPANGIFLQALSVGEFQPLDAFLEKVEELKAFARSRKPAPGFAEILLPGERARKTAAARRRGGIEIDAATWERLLQCAAEYGIEAPPVPSRDS